MQAATHQNLYQRPSLPRLLSLDCVRLEIITLTFKGQESAFGGDIYLAEA
jgi:hypothetical protein